MLFSDETFETIEQNLAFDELLIQEAEAGVRPREVLRIWEATSPFVVLGRSSRMWDEVHVELATQTNIPIRRRFSGGATILAAPGCLFYGVLLSLKDRPHLRMLDEAHRFVMSRVAEAIAKFQPGIQLDGTSDLVVEGRKVSGNSLRVQRNWLLYHGTLLLDMDLSLITSFLKHPPREPGYRGGRSHVDFLTNLRIPGDKMAASLRNIWRANEPYGEVHWQNIRTLVAEKYSQPGWNEQR